MCGLVGIAGDLAFRDERTMKQLLLLDFFRGPDSTGFASARGDGTVKSAKINSHPFDLFDSVRFREALNGNLSQLFMGHNRAATRGSVTTSNAHPFTYDHITGCHNGTLSYASAKALEDAIGESFSVDSQALFAAIAKMGVKEAVEMCEEGRDSTTGAWSLTWYDAKEKTLNFLRNKHRPLWYAYSKDFKRMFWASEWHFIDAATKMGGYEMYTEEKTSHRYWQTEEDVHLKFNLEALKAGGSRPKPTARLIKGKEPKAVGMTGTGTAADPFRRNLPDLIGMPRISGGSNQDSANVLHMPRTNSGTTSGSGASNSTPKIWELLGDIGRPFAGYITLEKFEEMSKYGCSWCGGAVASDDKGIRIYERDDIVLCAECVDEGNGDNHTRIYAKQDLYL